MTTPKTLEKLKTTYTVVQWTSRDSQTAIRRGWELFDSGDQYSLCRVDERAVFASDDDARMAVVHGALSGDKLSIKALLLALVNDPQQLAADISSLRNEQRIRALDVDGQPMEPWSTVKHRDPAAFDE